MNAADGYQRARELLKQRYGENYRIATAYIDRIVNGPVHMIKEEDSKALDKFSILLTSCKNTLEEIGYHHRLENPDSLLNVVNRLPFSLKKAWLDVADDISSNQLREITIEDLSKFVEKKARARTHPIFGKIMNEQKVRTPPIRRISAGVDSEVTLDVEELIARQVRLRVELRGRSSSAQSVMEITCEHMGMNLKGMR